MQRKSSTSLHEICIFGKPLLLAVFSRQDLFCPQQDRHHEPLYYSVLQSIDQMSFFFHRTRDRLVDVQS